MSAYETALKLEPGRISSLTGYIRAALPHVEHKVVEPQLDGGSREIANRLDELIDLAENREPRAVDWQKLGWHLSCLPLVHLRTGRGSRSPIVWSTGFLTRSSLPYRLYSRPAMIASRPFREPRTSSSMPSRAIYRMRTPR